MGSVPLAAAFLSASVPLLFSLPLWMTKGGWFTSGLFHMCMCVPVHTGTHIRLKSKGELYIVAAHL